MASDGHDLDQPVELVVRGDRVDVMGFVTAMHLVFNDKESTIDEAMNERGGHLCQALIDEIKRVDNFGAYEKELKRALRNDAVPGFRGAAVDYREYDPQHPEPTGPQVDRLPDLAAVDRYAVAVYREDEGFQAAGWPDHIDDVVEAMAFASFLRQYARDMEEATDVDDEAAMEAMGGD